MACLIPGPGSGETAHPGDPDPASSVGGTQQMKRAFPSLLLFSGVELIFLATFAVIGWAGWAILDIFGNEQKRFATLGNRLKQRKHIVKGANLFLVSSLYMIWKKNVL